MEVGISNLRGHKGNGQLFHTVIGNGLSLGKEDFVHAWIVPHPGGLAIGIFYGAGWFDSRGYNAQPPCPPQSCFRMSPLYHNQDLRQPVPDRSGGLFRNWLPKPWILLHSIP